MMRHCFSCSHCTEKIGSSEVCSSCLGTSKGFSNWCPDDGCLGIWNEERM